MLLLGIVCVATCAVGVYQFATKKAPRGLDESGPVARREPNGASRPAAAVASRAPAAPVRLSTHILDFGSVPVGYPTKRTLVILSRSAFGVQLDGLPPDSPFSAPQKSLSLSAGTPSEMTFTFDPAQPGTYEHQLSIQLDSPARDKLAVVLRGRAVRSLESAGVTVPPPPDLILRQYREQQIAKAAAEARAIASRLAREGSGSTAGQESGTMEAETSASGESATPAVSSGSPDAWSGGRARHAAMMAFGEVAGGSDDLNNVPVALPEVEKPELPQDEDPEADDPGYNNPGNGPGKKTRPQPKFTVAATSSILIHSSKQSIEGQVLPLRVVGNGTVFAIDGRIRFPDVVFAFGETVSLDQWGNIHGTVSTDGTVRMALTLRIHDPNGNVLDRAIDLTTAQAVGYSSAGRLMVRQGIPRDTEGILTLVGLSNIPVGAGSSLDAATIEIQLAGRLELGSL